MMSKYSFINALCILFLSVSFALIQFGCQINPSNSSDPNQQESTVVFEIPAEVKADMYCVTIVTQSGDTAALYYEVAKGNTLSVEVPSAIASTVTVNAFKNNTLKFTGAMLVPQGQRGLMKLPMQPVVIPDAPSSVGVILTEENYAALTWQPSSGAQGYTVYRTTDPAVLPTAIGKAGQCGFVDSTVELEAAYYYRIAAWNAGGESAPSAYVSIVIRREIVPPVPQNVQAAAASSTSITVSWNESAGATEYIVYGGTSSTSLSRLGTVSTTSYSHAGLAAGATYFYAVAASNASGASQPSACVSATTQPAPPETPTGVAATSTSSSSVTITWSAVTGATEYIIYGGTTSSSLMQLNTVSTTSYVHTGLSTGATYYYAVAATNASGASARSVIVSATTQSSAPAVPTGVTAAAASSTSIMVSWNESAGATEYTVYGGTTSSSLMQLNTVSTTSYVHTGLATGATYFYAVAASNSSGTSDRSATVSATTQATVLAAPTGVTATAASSSSITVAWSAVTGATSYSIYGGTSASALSQIGTATATSYFHTGLTAGATYFYAVAASNANGTSARSATVSATTQSTAPATPTGVTATAASSSSITVSWSAVTGATSYIVYGGTSSSSLSQVGTSTTTTYSHTGLTAATTYYYAVAASNTSGTSARCATVSATTQASGPATPTGVTATAASSSSITVSWSAVTGATSYSIYRGTSSSSLSQVGTSTTTTYTSTGLTASTTYYYAVAASNASGASARSATVSAATTAATVAKASINLSVCPQSRCNRCRPCPHGAISASYVVDPAKCVGKAACGHCFSVCPHNAISYK